MLISDLDHLQDANDASHATGYQTARVDFIIFLLTMTLTYVPVLVVVYATADDYAAVNAVSNYGTAELGVRLTGGGPLDAISNRISFSLTTTVDSLRYLRGLSVLGIVLLACCLSRFLEAIGWTFFESVLVSIIIVTAPTFQVYAALSVAAMYPYAALAAGGALWMTEQQLAATDLRNGAKSALPFLGALALLLVAINIHLPAAMFFWAFAGASLFRPGCTLRVVLLRFGTYLGVCVAALAVGVGLYHLGATLYGTGLLHALSSEIGTDAWSKLGWFVREPLVNALNWAVLFPHGWIAILVAITLMVGLLLYFEGNDYERLGQLAVAIVILPLAYLPNLVVAENWASYRTLCGLSAVVVVYFYLAMQGYLKLLRRFRPMPPTAAFLAVPALVACMLANYNVQTYFAWPLSRERAWIREQLEKTDLKNAKGIYVFPAEWHHSLAPGVRYDEFGLPFSSRDYALMPAVKTLVEELKPGMPVEIAPREGTRQPPADFVVVDTRKMWSLRFDR